MIMKGSRLNPARYREELKKLKTEWVTWSSWLGVAMKFTSSLPSVATSDRGLIK